MAYIVRCPQCNEVNGGSQLRCVKCLASLVGVPREQGESPIPDFVPAAPILEIHPVHPASLQAILGEDMGEKSVRKTGWLWMASLCLGLTSFIFSLKFLDWFWGADLGFTFLVGPIAGLAGIILGLIHSIKRKGGKWLSIPGIIFGILGLVIWGLFVVYGMFFAQ